MVFVLMLFLVLQPISANAETPSSLPTNGGSLDDTTYQLTEDTVINGELTVCGGYYNNVYPKIDLNGHKLTITSISVQASGDLTIYDSSAGKTGEVTGGKITVSTALAANSGKISSAVEVKGTLMKNDDTDGATFTGTVTNNGAISGGTFSGTVENKDNGVINDGTFSTSSTVTNYNTLMGGTFNGTVINGRIIYGGTFNGTVKNGYEHEIPHDQSEPEYEAKIGSIEGGEFYGTVTNDGFPHNYDCRNIICGGWFYQCVPAGYVTYQDYTIFYYSKNGTFLGINVLKDPGDGNGVTPDYSYMPKGKTADTFDCWYTDEYCTQKVDKESPEKVTKNIALYGKTKTGDDSAEIEDPWDNPFKDVHEYDWFYNSVKFCHKRGWFNGKTKTLFAPYDTFTRAEISAVLYNRAGTPAVNTNRVLYVDVKEGAWYTKAVYWMTDRGNAVGANNHFYPDNPVTREEIATMLYNAAGRPETNGTLFQYLDKNDGSDWAYEALCWVVEKGIMIGDGDGTLRPKDNVTRAEAASIMRSFGIAGYGDYVATN